MIQFREIIKHHNLISSELPFQHVADKSKWWLRNKTFIDISRVITEAAVSLKENRTLDSGISILKQINRKVILRISEPLISGESFVAKVFFMPTLTRMLKYYKYGLDEAANLILACSKGLPAPKVYGYGHIYNRFGLVEKNIVFMEDLREFIPLRLCLEQNRDDPDACGRLLLRTVPIFESLYNAHCNHIDVNGGAIMLSGEKEGRVSILDFQHAKYMDMPSTEVLMAEAGRLSLTFKKYADEKAIENWLDAILTAIGINSDHEKQSLHMRFQHYSNVSFSLSRRERKRIK